MLAGALDRRQVSAERLSYEGPFGVGYGVVSFTLGDPDEKRNFAERYLEEVNAEHQKRVSRADPYTALAIATIEQYVREGSVPPLPDRLPSELTEKQAAVFVSIKKFGNLRGCIGTLRPVTASIAEEIQRNAVLACSKDPRFNAVGAGELTYLEVSVDVLTLPEPVDGLDKLDPKRYGVIVSSGGRSGVLLPDLEGVDSVEQQIAICRQKGGIGPQEPVSLQRFEVIRHH
ncbi:MAG: AmmeMemoRadiSam system protein A [Succinivibrio sp.]|nr:AmmeMemoRadiSam system protein A [Succinivibrio sp.]